MEQSITNYRPHAVSLLKKYGSNPHRVTMAIGINYVTVREALDQQSFARCAFGTVLRVRAEVERQLREAGWSGDSQSLWREYDMKIQGRAAA